MGIDQSLPKLDPNEKQIKEINRGVTTIPFKLPPSPKVQYLNLSGNNIKELPPKLSRLAKLFLAKNDLNKMPKEMISVIANYSALEELDLSYNDLEEIPAVFSRLKNLKTINLFGNKLKSYPLEMVTVQTIDLAQNQFTEIPQFNQKITSLSMEANKISEINCKMPLLVKLNLAYNVIEHISPTASFKILESLDLSYNLITKLPDFAKFTPRLRRIDLSHNFIEEIPNLPRSLSVLMISDNKIKSLPKDFSQFPYIVHFDFSQNQITKVPTLPISVQIIDFSQNYIEEIAPAETPDLIDMRIFGNNLSEMPRFTSNQLVEISLRNNNIRSLDYTLLHSDLSKLDLSFNELESIPEELFSLSSLFELNLSKNKIKTLPAKISESIIVFLDLSNNPIESLPELPQTIEVLDLSGCNLSEVPSILPTLTCLDMLSLASNKLKSMPTILTLRYLSISQNNFQELPNLVPGLLSLDASMNSIREIPAEMPKGLIELNLSYNRIKKFPQGFSAPQLKNLNMSNNPLDGSLDVGILPRLTQLNVAATKLIVAGNARKLHNIIGHDETPLAENTSVLEAGVNACFCSIRGAASQAEDVPMIRMRFAEDTAVFGVIHAHESVSTGIAVGRFLNEKLSAARKHLDGDVLDTIVNDSLRLAEDGSSSYKETCMVVGILQGRLLTLSQVGLMRIAIVSKSGTVKYTTANSARKVSDSAPFVPRESLAMLRSLGRRLVFGSRDPPITETLIVDDNDAYIVIASECVFDDFDSARLGELALRASSAKELCFEIRNLSFTHTRKRNTTVFVAGLGSDATGIKRSASSFTE